MANKAVLIGLIGLSGITIVMAMVLWILYVRAYMARRFYRPTPTSPDPPLLREILSALHLAVEHPAAPWYLRFFAALLTLGLASFLLAALLVFRLPGR